MENKIYTKKRVNYDKLNSKLPILRVNYDKLHSTLPIFRVKSVKHYIGQKEFTRAPPVTNMRYGFMMLLLVECDTIPSPANMCVYDTWLFMVSEIISRPLCFATDIARMETPVT